jgi:hypothetical protein
MKTKPNPALLGTSYISNYLKKLAKYPETIPFNRPKSVAI